MKTILVDKDTATYVIHIDAAGKRHTGVCTIVYTYVRNKRRVHFINSLNRQPIFPGQYYDYALDFQNGYALVVQNDRYYHINLQGKVAYPWRFSDAGPIWLDGTVSVQHPRAHGWSVFDLNKSQFVLNPPRYTR